MIAAGVAVGLAMPPTTALAVDASDTTDTSDDTTDDPTVTSVGAGGSAVPAFLFRNGRYRAFEAPNADVAIYPSGINDRGEVTGEYIRTDRESGFVRRRNGRISTFDVPGCGTFAGNAKAVTFR